jgi:regulatory protein
MDTSPDVKETLEAAFTKALKFLSYRPRSEKEVTDFLSKKGYGQEIIDNVLHLLKKQKFLGYDDFVIWWIEQRQEFKNTKSRFVIKNELLKKGVNGEIIDKHLEESTGDYEIAKQTLEKNKRKFERYSGRDYFQKASSFLQRKGFSWDIVRRALKEDSLD